MAIRHFHVARDRVRAAAPAPIGCGLSWSGISARRAGIRGEGRGRQRHRDFPGALDRSQRGLGTPARTTSTPTTATAPGTTPPRHAAAVRRRGPEVGNFMVANSDGDGVFDREFFRGRPDPLSTARTVLYWNQEFRSTIWGHMTLLNLQHVVEPIFTGFLGTTNPWDVPDQRRHRRPHAPPGRCRQLHPPRRPVDDPYHGAYTAKALPIDVALGKIDTMDVMGTNHEASPAL